MRGNIHTRTYPDHELSFISRIEKVECLTLHTGGTVGCNMQFSLSHIFEVGTGFSNELCDNFFYHSILY